MFKRAAFLVVGCGALLAGCGDAAQDENREIISNLTEAGIPARSITVVDDVVYVGGDARVGLEASREMLNPGEDSHEQYRSTNIVATTVTRICITPTATFNSYSALSQALDMAIVNYNSLGLRISFMRGSSTSCQAIMTAQAVAGTVYSSGFPSGGRPYNSFSIGTGLIPLGTDYLEHAITHVIGHAIGLHHTDAYDPTISCGPNGPPPSHGGGVGGILIPGTPTTATPGGSIMNTCIPIDTNGEFTNSDIVALNVLY